MVINVVVSTGEVQSFLANKASMIIDALRAETRAQLQNLLSYIQNEKLNGQVLNRVKGRLYKGGVTEFKEETGVFKGSVIFGRNVPYARILNYGGTINVPAVDGKLMVFERAGQTVFTTRHKAFTVQMPAHNFMESSLTEREPEIRAAYAETVQKATAEAAGA